MPGHQTLPPQWCVPGARAYHDMRCDDADVLLQCCVLQVARNPRAPPFGFVAGDLRGVPRSRTVAADTTDDARTGAGGGAGAGSGASVGTDGGGLHHRPSLVVANALAGVPQTRLAADQSPTPALLELAFKCARLKTKMLGDVRYMVVVEAALVSMTAEPDEHRWQELGRTEFVKVRARV